MTKSTRNLMALVVSVTILTLALFAVGPALAQTGGSGSGGQTAQGGNTVVISTGDTLGTLVTRYNLTGTNLRDFLSMNSNLPLVPGQRVVFPAGLSANVPTTGGQGQSSSSGSSSTSSTNTPVATTAATTAATGTPAATAAATTAATATTSASSSSGTSGSSSTGSQTAQFYTTKPGDTLGTILNMMGLQASTTSGTGAAVNTPVATTAATTAATVAATVAASPTVAATVAASPTVAATVAASPTVAATMAATTAATATTSASGGAASSTATPAASGGAVSSTATPVATSAATVAATPTSAAAVASPTVAATVAATATTSASSSSSSSSSTSGSGPTDAQLTQWIRANSGLRFGLVVSLPAGVPATGGTNGNTGTSGTSGNNGSNVTSGTSNGTIPNTGLSGLGTMSGSAAANIACSSKAPSGYGFYKVKGGDTLQSIAKAVNSNVTDILRLNPGASFTRGSIVLLPGAEAPGFWDVKSMCPNGTGSNTNNTSGSTVPPSR